MGRAIWERMGQIIFSLFVVSFLPDSDACNDMDEWNDYLRNEEAQSIKPNIQKHAREYGKVKKEKRHTSYKSTGGNYYSVLPLCLANKNHVRSFEFL